MTYKSAYTCLGLANNQPITLKHWQKDQAGVVSGTLLGEQLLLMQHNMEIEIHTALTIGMSSTCLFSAALPR